MPKKPNNQFVSAELNQVSMHFSACTTLSVGFLQPGSGMMEHHFFLACFKINTDNLSIMSCLFGKTWSIFSLSQMSFNYALTHNYRCNFNDYLSICVKLGEKAPKHGNSCANTVTQMKVLIWTRRNCWHAGGSSFIS